MLRRLFPHPGLTLVLILVWLGLVNEFRWGSLVFAILLGSVFQKTVDVLFGVAVQGSSGVVVNGFI